MGVAGRDHDRLPWDHLVQQAVGQACGLRRCTALQQENAAISARLRQAQGTLDQIASAARLMNPTAGANGTPGRPLGGEPPSPPAATQARTHIVVDGDSLSRISLRYYGTPNRWQEIYDANRDSLAGANALRPGQPLRIP